MMYEILTSNLGFHLTVVLLVTMAICVERELRKRKAHKSSSIEMTIPERFMSQFEKAFHREVPVILGSYIGEGYIKKEIGTLEGVVIECRIVDLGREIRSAFFIRDKEGNTSFEASTEVLYDSKSGQAIRFYSRGEGPELYPIEKVWEELREALSGGSEGAFKILRPKGP